MTKWTAGRIVALAVLVLGGATVAITLLLSHGSGSAFSAPPQSYVVVYRNVINGVPQWEVLAAQRPLEGSDLTYRTPTRPGVTATADAGTISTATGLYTEGAEGVQLVSGRQPGPPSNDLWLTIEMRDALARGVAVDLHRTRNIAGMRCSVYRLSDPPSGPLHQLNMAVGHDDVCLAANGLLLSETWTYHGAVVEQRTAVTVAIGSWPAATPRPGSTASAAPASAAAALVTPDAHPVSFLAAPTAPSGFRPAVSPVDFRLPDSEHPAQTVAATVVWTFIHGNRVITVEAGRERGGVLPWSNDGSPTHAITLPGLGDASTALRSDGPEVRIDVGAGRWVRVRGTVPPAELTDYAGTLRLR